MTFFKSLWRDDDRDGAFTVWLSNKTSLHLPVRDLSQLGPADIAELQAIADEDKSNVYFGLALRHPRFLTEPDAWQHQGGKKDCIALPGFALDIDFYDPVAHKATNLPKDLDEAECILLPDDDDSVACPTSIVDTGNGVHPYYLFYEPVTITRSNLRALNDAFEAFQRPYIERGNANGFHVDLTATINRVWRLPGFINQKTGKKTSLIFEDLAVLHDPGDLGIPSSALSPVAAVSTQVPSAVTNSAPTKSEYLDVDLKEIATMLGKTNNKFKQEITEALAGRSPAPRGKRDIVMQGICSALAWLPEARSADPKELVKILIPSLTVWAEEPDADLSLDEEIEKAIDKIERSQDDWRQQQAHKQPAIDALARMAGLKPTTPPEIIERHAIIQKQGTYFAFDFRKNRYSHALTKDELGGYIDKVWANGPIPLYFYSDDDTKKKKPVPFLTDHYREVAIEVVGDLRIEKSHYDAEEETFYQAMAIRRVTEPRYDPDIDEWVHLLVGDALLSNGDPKIDRMLDWMAAVPQLQHQSCVLYLEGVSGAGKGLLANGLARLWTTGGPTEFQSIVDDYNGGIADCPFIFADEGLTAPKKKSLSALLRSLVGSSTLTLNEKYLVHRRVIGSVRLMLAANNDEALSFGNENLSIHDLEAVAGRFLHVYARREAADWLKAKNTNGQLTRAWVDGDLLARHCLYLMKTRKIRPGKRFFVEGDEEAMHRKMLLRGGIDGLVHEWLVRFATKPVVLEQRYKARSEKPLAYIDNSEFYVNSQAVVDCWDAYMPSTARCPGTQLVGSILSKISYDKRRVGSRGSRARYHVIQPGLVLELSQDMQVGNEDVIEANLGLETGG